MINKDTDEKFIDQAVELLQGYQKENKDYRRKNYRAHAQINDQNKQLLNAVTIVNNMKDKIKEKDKIIQNKNAIIKNKNITHNKNKSLFSQFFASYGKELSKKEKRDIDEEYNKNRKVYF